MSHIPSPNQKAIYDAIKNTTDPAMQNIAVLATAGAGKTTTIVQALNYVPLDKDAIFFSFSKAIVEELQSRVPSHIPASTLHSFGFRQMRRYFRGSKIEVTREENSKYLRLSLGAIKKELKKEFIGKKEFRTAKLIEETCNYARMTLTPNTEEDLMKMCMYYNIDFDEMSIHLSQQLLKDALKAPKNMSIDFTDMIYFPAMIPEILNGVKFDYIFLDEAQDTNKAQYAMLERLLPSHGRLISVGDDYQSIYGFSGADIDAFKRIRERPNTITLPLSVSYRCPKHVVRKAQEVCPTIEAWENAPEGEERFGSWTEIQEGDMVLSRTTKPLVELYFMLLDKGVKAQVVGRDIEKGLIALVEECMSETLEGVKYNLNMKFEELRKELQKDGVKIVEEHFRWRALEEKVQVISLIMKKVSGAQVLVQTIKDIFHEDKKAAKLMTIHRSKGLENPRVFVILKVSDQPLMPSKWARQDWEHTQETNLQFVAYTRAKESLIYLTLE